MMCHTSGTLKRSLLPLMIMLICNKSSEAFSMDFCASVCSYTSFGCWMCEGYHGSATSGTFTLRQSSLHHKNNTIDINIYWCNTTYITIQNWEHNKRVKHVDPVLIPTITLIVENARMV